jgi:antitoxin (DNA-binding transcriptional repressor) of toxin-antitoxin stability system
MLKVTVSEATSRLLELINAVKKGESVIITTDEAQAFQIVPIEIPDREPGHAKGKFWMSDDFDEPLEDFKDQNQCG